MRLSRLTNSSNLFSAAKALVCVLFSRLTASVARVRTVRTVGSYAAALATAIALAVIPASPCSVLCFGILRVVPVRALAPLPLAAIFSEPTFARRTVFPVSAGRLRNPLASSRSSRGNVRASCHHEVHNGQPMMIFGMVRLMANGASRASVLEVGCASCRISSHISGLSGTDLFMMILPQAVAALAPRSPLRLTTPMRRSPQPSFLRITRRSPRRKSPPDRPELDACS